jgi:hypothetical protein
MRSIHALAALVLLPACGGGGTSPFSNPTPKGPGDACTATAQCVTGLECASGVCTATKVAGDACAATVQCSGSLVCYVGTCTALPAAGSCPSTGGAPLAVAGSMFDPGDPGPSACVSTVRLPAFEGAPDVVVQDLGEHAVNSLVTFAVTTGTTAVSIVSQEVNGTAADLVNLGAPYGVWPNSVVPDALRKPDGSLYFDDLSPLADAVAPVVYWASSPVSGTLTGPNTSYGLEALRQSTQLAPGTWSFLVNDWANECTKGVCTIQPPGTNSGRYHVHAVTKTAPLTSTGALDVEVYLLTDTSDGVTTAAGAATSPRLQRWAASLAHFLAGGGLCLGTVTFHDLPAWVHTAYPNDTVDVTGSGPCDPLQQLFATSAAPGRSVNLFLAHKLTDGSSGPVGTTTVGMDGSIPGPSAFPGTIASGAVVGLFNALTIPTTWPGACVGGTPDIANCGPDFLAYVAAHEIGHWLGLYHVTEFGGTSWDPLTDTPECHTSCQSGGAGSGGMRVSSCLRGGTCGGGDNLMFWLVQQGLSTGNLTRDQGQLMRLNPAVR